MRTTRVIPCLDVDDGRVVKGVNFVGLRDAGDPVELAARYDDEGADELVFLDITASSDGRETMIDVARRTAEKVFIPFTVGGGIRSVDDARRAAARRRRQGVGEHGGGRAARAGHARSPTEFGAQCVVCAIDARGARRQPAAGRSSRTAGARRPGSTRSRGSRKWSGVGAGEILLTSMDRDGTARRLRPRAHARGQRRRRRARHRERRGRHASTTSSTACSRAAPTRCSPRRSSTSASTPSPRPSRCSLLTGNDGASGGGMTELAPRVALLRRRRRAGTDHGCRVRRDDSGNAAPPNPTAGPAVGEPPSQAAAARRRTSRPSIRRSLKVDAELRPRPLVHGQARELQDHASRTSLTADVPLVFALEPAGRRHPEPRRQGRSTTGAPTVRSRQELRCQTLAGRRGVHGPARRDQARSRCRRATTRLTARTVTAPYPPDFTTQVTVS